MKEMEWLSPTHGLKSVREDCAPRDWQEIEIYISWTINLGKNQ
jgi:hypothetical protein